MNYHLNDAIDNITTEKRFLKESIRGLRNKIDCIIYGCLAMPIDVVFYAQNIIVIHMYSHVFNFTQMRLKSLIWSRMR
jgi:hypothetical protein